MAKQKPVPVIDLFAGPGGLGEGFSSLTDENGERRFSLRVSIEKDPVAHRTLSLRALFRWFPKGKVPDCYYDYVRGNITREELFKHPSIPDEARIAASEAKCAELGKAQHTEIDKWISEALEGADEWVLIGGPPCQAYSLAGRSRRTREATAEFEKDEKHLLYKEYLRIIRKFSPSVFVMENVKGILSSKHSGSPIFERILADLASPGGGFKYRIRSFTVPLDGDEPEPNDFIIEAERFGVPQCRHRVIIFGDALVEPRGNLIAQRRQAGNSGAGPLRAGQHAGDGLVIRQRPFVGQPTAVNRQAPERRCVAPAHQPTPRNIPVGIALTHPHQSLSVVMHFEFPPAHRPSGEKAGKATDATLKIPKCPLLLLSHWLHYADHALAPIRRSSTGSNMPVADNT